MSSLIEFLDEKCPHWRIAPLALVNAHLRLHGPREILLTSHNQKAYGVIQISKFNSSFIFGKPGKKVSVLLHFRQKWGITLRYPKDRLVYLANNPGSLIPAETIQMLPI
ncbi:hypothetical protein B9Z55_011160 [Caenorhabditis nigoni]|uniref:Uncharacterized protein n=1 Tax=Caenorhabditis nigoni TaxID=1611254 RepID=A0A2G5UJS6_9PELO|nr:hypothetical protein B9Z55_011160 [Caenorhabditis nigoni]